MPRPNNDIPVLKGFIVGNQIKVWCPYCRDFHTHGLEDGFKAMNHHRVAHCYQRFAYGKLRECMSPFKETGYYIEPFTKKEIGKGEAAQNLSSYIPDRPQKLYKPALPDKQ